MANLAITTPWKASVKQEREIKLPVMVTFSLVEAGVSIGIFASCAIGAPASVFEDATDPMMALTLLTFILFTDKYIEQVPIAALVGVMFMMVIETFAWSSFRIIRKIPKSDAFVLIIVSAVTVIYDLAIAVFVGVIISALVFAWENAKKIRARKRFSADGKTKTYEIWGPLFFGSILAFNDKFDVKNDPENVEIDFIESRISDHSALEAIFN